MPSKEFPIPFPLGGWTKDRGYQSSDPHTTRDAVNVTPDDAGEARTRGGSRPGLTKRYSTKLDGPPLYMVRVGTTDDADTRVYEYLVVGTVSNIYIGKSIASGTTLPITYTEQLAPLSGELCTESGIPIIIEQSPFHVIVVADFSFDGIVRELVAAYQGTVVLGVQDIQLLT